MANDVRYARWDTMLQQAELFADAEQFTDAVARAELAFREIQAELRAARTIEERTALERRSFFVSRRLDRIRERHAQWQAAVRSRATQFVVHEGEELGQPLPVRPPSR